MKGAFWIGGVGAVLSIFTPILAGTFPVQMVDDNAPFGMAIAVLWLTGIATCFIVAVIFWKNHPAMGFVFAGIAILSVLFGLIWQEG